ncbi:uncharacterized protein LOC120674203 isoform X1 [Panicum virgatum]|uniref:uncharacterized protein LOC120674203 isoform X1 n=1 Tax=Panicum virgatum TaxID=38727 RepID=UPI0019D5F43F|nr:uncharacterized protein LOC120674203 isoform X1 [Panicum virgatum]
MGCWGSKASADVAVADVYRPPPTSVSLFDISAVEEPWLIAKNKAGDEEDDDEEEEEETDEEDDEEEEKTVVPLPLLEKLEGYELAPASWSEVSKALEDMKPVLLDSKQANTKPPDPKKKKKKKMAKKKKEEEQPAAEQKLQQPTTTTAVAAAGGGAANEEAGKKAPPELAGRRVVKDNPFLMRDRESSKAGSAPRWKRRDPFEGCPERRPPGAAGGGVVLYTTTLHGVRRTFEDCERARGVVEACAEAAGVGAVDERDVSLHGEAAAVRDGAVRGRRGGVREAGRVREAEGDDALGEGARRGGRGHGRPRLRGLRRRALRAVLGVRRQPPQGGGGGRRPSASGGEVRQVQRERTHDVPTLPLNLSVLRIILHASSIASY